MTALVCAALFVFASPTCLATAQDEKPKDNPPATAPPTDTTQKQKSTDDTTQKSVEEIRKELEQQDPAKSGAKPASDQNGQNENTGEPSKTKTPLVVNLASARPAGGRLVPEGSYLLSAGGVLQLNRSTGVLDFVLDRGMPDATNAELKISLSPCHVTERIMSAMTDSDVSEHVELSGRVFVYENRNYLIPTANPLRVTSLPPKPNEQLMREGATIVARLARITRSEAGGEWMVTFDSDHTGQQDPPMILLPCRLLEQMVQIAKSDGDMTKLIVSGQVLVYQDRNYLLPTFMLRPRLTGNLSP